METQDGPHTARNGNPDARIGPIADGTSGREPGVDAPRHLAALPEPFQIVESTTDGRRVIALCGELDLSNAARLEARLGGRIDTVLDLSELSFIDSSGIRVVISTAQRAQSEEWEFTVANPQPAVLRVIKLVGLAHHLGLESQNGRASHRDADAEQSA